MENGRGFRYSNQPILISVAPGNYTAIKGADGGTGNGLVEVDKLAA